MTARKAALAASPTYFRRQHSTTDEVDRATAAFHAAAVEVGLLVPTWDPATDWAHLDRLVSRLQLDPDRLSAAEWDALTARLTGPEVAA